MKKHVPKMAKMRLNKTKMKGKITHMRPTIAKMRPQMAKMGPKMAGRVTGPGAIFFTSKMNGFRT